jgi:hypothetical protein
MKSAFPPNSRSSLIRARVHLNEEDVSGDQYYARVTVPEGPFEFERIVFIGEGA